MSQRDVVRCVRPDCSTTYYFVVVPTTGPATWRAFDEVSATPIVLAPRPIVTATDAPDPVAAGATLTTRCRTRIQAMSPRRDVVISEPRSPPIRRSCRRTGPVALSRPESSPGRSARWRGRLGLGAARRRVASPLPNGTLTQPLPPWRYASNESGSVAGPGVTTTVNLRPGPECRFHRYTRPVAPGATLTYTLSYANTGQCRRDVLPRHRHAAGQPHIRLGGHGTLSGSSVNVDGRCTRRGASVRVQLRRPRRQPPLANGTVSP